MSTGAFAECRAEWGTNDVFDMSGNAKEWTATEPETGLYEIRGGGYSNIEGGRKCAYDFTVGDANFSFQNTGFRCCHYTAPTCATYTSTNVPLTISGAGTSNSTLSVATGGAIADVDVVSVTGTTTRFSHLRFRLTSPDGTQITLVPANQCASNDNWNFGFDDDAAQPGSTFCNNNPVGRSLIWQPTTTFGASAGALAAFDGESSSGTWTLEMTDSDGSSSNPTLTGWGLQICNYP
jgi:subtilisin-like proprotein convertase family protein